MNPANAWLLLTCRSIGVDHTPGGFGAVQPADVAASLRGLERKKFLMGLAALAGDQGVLRELESLIWADLTETAASERWEIRRGSQIMRRLTALALYETLNKDRCIVCNGTGIYSHVAARPSNDVERAEWLGRRSEDIKQLRRGFRRLRKLERRASMLQDRRDAGCANRNEKRRLRNVLRWIEDYERLVDLQPEPIKCETCQGKGRHKLTELRRAWLVGVSSRHWHRTWSARYEPVRIKLEGWISDCLSHVRRGLGSFAA